MKLTLGLNWDRNLIEQLQNIPEVYEVYGSTDMTFFGSGRSSYMLKKISKEDFPVFIKFIHQHNLKFSFTLNAPCLDNREYSKETHNEMLDQLDWLAETGIDGITVSIPYLIEIIKRRYPKLHVKVSLVAAVNSVQKARFYEDMGVNEILVDQFSNRDFKLLEKIRKAVKCELGLITNVACNNDCINQNYHYSSIGHSSQSSNITKGYYIDYCNIKCSIERLKNPHQLISSPWIRPEDIKQYENIGYDIFKISGRRMSTPWLLNAAKVYASRSLDGNLSEILDLPQLGLTDGAQPVNLNMVAEAQSKLNSTNTLKIGQLNPKRPQINNKALDGFIDFFVDGNCNDDCTECNYCKDFSRKAITIDASETKRQLSLYESIYEDLVTSTLFTDSPEVNISNNSATQEATMSINNTITIQDKHTEVISFVLEKVPEHARAMIEADIINQIKNNASTRNASETNDNDLVESLLKTTPDHARLNLIYGLKMLGFDMSKYSN
jgi:collagenase-like PrtC family protease